MPALPLGTVTFLFTDIDGSTKLWEHYPEAMKTVLAKHDALLVQTVKEHQGQIVKTTGDGIHAAFETAVDAVAAACAAQQALQAAEWDAIKPQTIRVRMGLHTGEAQIRAGDYYGTSLNRAARLMSVGSGGQILISNTTAELVRDGLPKSAYLRDLGQHRLKDLLRPEHIYQLVHTDLPAEFPPVKTFDTIPNNLPVQLTGFIGREQEIADIQGLLKAGRLITLIGPGGTGKSRLAQEVGALELANFPHGIWLVELAPLTAPSQIIPAIAQAVGLQEALFQTFHALVFDYLRDKQALLILDNCEHLIEDCARLADDLLHQCTRLKIVASSREGLGIAGEVAYGIPPMTGAEATQLFMDRARAVNPKYHGTENSGPAISQICARLDGIPLAIELAAARVKLLSPEQIAARLNDRFRLLIGGSRTALPRQQTLRALIDWSYDLLSEEEQHLLRATSVFVGGWTLEAIEAVVDDPNLLETLEQLVNKSLVATSERAQGMRYSLLETIRQYAREKLLDKGEAAQVRDRHFAYFDDFSETAWIKVRSPEVYAWVDQIEDEIENFRAAFDWGLEQHPEEILHLAANTTIILSSRGYLPEGRTWIKSALERLETLPPVTGEALLRRQKLRARALWARANAEIGFGENYAAVQDLKEAIAISRQTGDQSMLGNSLQTYYVAASFVGESDAPAAAEEGLEILSKIDDQWGIAQAYVNMARVAMQRGNLSDRAAFTKKATQVEADAPLITAYSYLGLGMSESYLGHLDEAREHFQAGLVLFQRLKNKAMETVMLSELGHIARRLGDLAQAIDTYKRTLPRWQELGARAAIANQLECFALVAAAQNQLPRAARLFGAAEALRERINGPMTEQERIEYDQALAQLLSTVNAAEFSAGWMDGRAMTMEEAIQFAID